MSSLRQLRKWLNAFVNPAPHIKKAGIILSGLVPDTSIQSNLFESSKKGAGRFFDGDNG